MMLERLKSLPLTILLTILIWMYAESQVSSARTEATLLVKDVPVALSGSPELLKDVLAQCDVIFEPGSVSVQVAGAPDRIEALSQRALGGGSATGIRAYVEMTAEDKPPAGGAGVVLSRPLRVVPPAEFMVLQAPERVSLRLVAKRAGTGSAPEGK